MHSYVSSANAVILPHFNVLSVVNYALSLYYKPSLTSNFS